MSEKYKNKVITIPNMLSITRIALIPLFVWLYAVKHLHTAAGIVFIISGITDIVDGFIARRFQMISDIGKVLDPVADKLTQVAMLICLLLRFPLMLIPFGLLIIKEIYMAISGVLVIQRTGQVLSADWPGKSATALLYAMMILHILCEDIALSVSVASILICAFMIVISFVLYAIRNTKALYKNNK